MEEELKGYEDEVIDVSSFAQVANNVSKKRNRDQISNEGSHLDFGQRILSDGDPIADRAYATAGGVGSGSHYFDQRQRTVKVSRSQLAGAGKSKLDFYNILASEGQFYLPPFDECPMLFIRDIMFGRKKVGHFDPMSLLLVGLQELRHLHDQGTQLPRVLGQECV